MTFILKSISLRYGNRTCYELPDYYPGPRADVTLGTLRKVMIVQGRRGPALMLGFVEMIIWVSVVLKIITQLNSPFYGGSYALGFGLGNFLRVTLESYIGFGEQVVRVFTRITDLAGRLREAGYAGSPSWRTRPRRPCLCFVHPGLAHKRRVL